MSKNLTIKEKLIKKYHKCEKVTLAIFMVVELLLN